MAFERPTLARLISRAKADIMTRLDGADANLRGSPEEVLAIVCSGMTHGLHGHLKWLSKQLLADLADDEFLLRWASIYGVERISAVAAQLSLTVVGTTGAVCPSGTVWQRGDGVSYTQTADVTLAGGTAVAVVAANTAGNGGNAVVGTKLQITSPVVGITSEATIGAALTDGTDIETIDALRARLLLRLQTPPKGGSAGDYINWALEVAGVTRAWEAPGLYGARTVGLRFVRDNDASIIPDASEVAAVQAHIDTRRPITADVVVIAPVAVPLYFTISITPNTDAVRTAAAAELQDMVFRDAEPGSTIYISRINEAISLATGETNHSLMWPITDVVHTANQIAIFGAVNWL